MFDVVITIALFCGPRGSLQNTISYLQTRVRTEQQRECEKTFMDCISDWIYVGHPFGKHLVIYCASGVTPDQIKEEQK